MIGICIELKTECLNCGNPLMLNALVDDFVCPSCNKKNNFTYENWAGLLDDSFENIGDFKPGEGQPSTIFRGQYRYNLLYGRQEPRCRNCKTNIDVSKIETYAKEGKTKCTKCSFDINVRTAPEEFAKQIAGVRYLIGEDADLIGGHSTTAPLPNSAKPVLFTCPSCAGNLEIDGSARMVVCKYCSSQIYLPDDLWARLHPAAETERWYILYDEVAAKVDKLPEWYYIPGFVIDKEGYCYICSGLSDRSNYISVWSFAPDLKVRWVRDDLKFDHDHAGLALTNDGNLYLWAKNKHSLLKLSSKDGSTIQKIEGKPDPHGFNLKGCTTLISDKDGSILAIINNTFARFSPQGERINLWSGLKFGLFSSGIGNKIPENDDEYAPFLSSVHSMPKRIDSDFTKMNIGWDGYLYMIDKSSDGTIAKFNMAGNKLASHSIPLRYKDCAPWADADGNMYIIGSKESDSNTNLIKITENGYVTTLLTDIKEGGVLDEEDQLALAPDGRIYIYKFYNRLKIFSPEMEMIFRSEQSREDDEEVLAEKKRKVEDDEEFS